MRLLTGLAEAKSEDESAFTVLSMGGLVTLIGYIVMTFATWPYAGAGLLWALALYSAGLFVGFLFSIARVVEVAKGSTSDEIGLLRYVPNGAIEQIADWLTKIIVGLTLIELQQIPDAIDRLAEHVSDALAPGGRVDAVQFAGGVAIAMIVFFPIMGFLAAYLSTRLFLNPEIKRREDAMQEARKAIEVLDEAARQGSDAVLAADASQDELWVRSSRSDILSGAGSPSEVAARALHAIASAAGIRTRSSDDPHKMLVVVRTTVDMRGRQEKALQTLIDILEGLNETTADAYLLAQRIQATLLDLARRKGNEFVFEAIQESAHEAGRKVEIGAKRGNPGVRIELLVDDTLAFIIGTAIVKADLEIYAARVREYVAALKPDIQTVIALNDPYGLVERVNDDYPAVLFRVGDWVFNETGRRALSWLVPPSD